jgi:hypothetical protein
MLSNRSTVHTGIYEGSKDELRVYTAIGALPKPGERMLEIMRDGHVEDFDENP